MNIIYKSNTISALDKKKEMINALRNSMCTVEFTKVDGTFRLMECTLDAKYLPIQEPKVNDDNNVEVKKTSKPLSEHLIRVYDIEAKGWRTINLNNLLQFIQN